MNVSFNKAAIVATALLAALVLTNAALAAVSLGYPKGRPYYGFRHQHSAARLYNYYAPSYSTPMEDTRQSFSYAPTETDSKSDAAQESHEPAMKSNQAQNNHSGEEPTVRRSYSYDPEPQRSTTRVRGGRRWNAVGEPWQYQKTDPRRMGR
jgi:hypothetical protein